MDGWTAHAGPKPYEGTLTKGDRAVVANPYTPHESLISRANGAKMTESDLKKYVPPEEER
jgi:hypothetical protein